MSNITEPKRGEKYSFQMCLLVVKLAKRMTHNQVADHLNRHGYKTARGKAYSKAIIHNIVNKSYMGHIDYAMTEDFKLTAIPRRRVEAALRVLEDML